MAHELQRGGKQPVLNYCLHTLSLSNNFYVAVERCKDAGQHTPICRNKLEHGKCNNFHCKHVHPNIIGWRSESDDLSGKILFELSYKGRKYECYYLPYKWLSNMYDDEFKASFNTMIKENSLKSINNVYEVANKKASQYNKAKYEKMDLVKKNIVPDDKVKEREKAIEGYEKERASTGVSIYFFVEISEFLNTVVENFAEEKEEYAKLESIINRCDNQIAKMIEVEGMKHELEQIGSCDFCKCDILRHQFKFTVCGHNVICPTCLLKYQDSCLTVGCAYFKN